MTAEHSPARWQSWATAPIAGLSVVASALGLFRPGFYNDPAVLLPQLYGQDVVTLGFGVPLLLIGLWAARRGSLRGYVVWLGALGFHLYTWASYVAMLTFNPFFLGYTALFSLSLFTFVGGVVGLDATAVKRRLKGRLPIRLLCGYVVVMVALISVGWLSDVVPATLADETPERIVVSELPTNVIYVLDLAVILPGALITAWWLWNRRPWGYVFIGVLLVKLASIGLAVLSMAARMHLAGQDVAVAEASVFGFLTAVAAVLGVLYLLSFDTSGRTG